MTALVRAAAETDAPAIAGLLDAAFGGQGESALVAALRAEGAVVLELVAERDGLVLGHLLFSAMRVGEEAALALAPLAVAPEAQGGGVGSALLREGLARIAARRSESLVMVLGEPGYYGRFGFSPALAAAVTGVPWSGHPAFQALRLRPGPVPEGPARYACAFGASAPEGRGDAPPGKRIMSVTGLPPYDDTNIFARLLRGEIPARKVYEDEFAFAFHDINPQAPVHVLVIPKGRYVSFADFSASATAQEIAGFWRAVGHVARELGLEATGYRLLTNMGVDGGQEVPHFHVHLFGGRRIGRMVPQA